MANWLGIPCLHGGLAGAKGRKVFGRQESGLMHGPPEAVVGSK